MPELGVFSEAVMIRLMCFIGVLALMMIGEKLVPRRQSGPYKTRRWISNLAVVVLNTLALRLVFPILAIDMAFLADKQHWGLFHHVEIAYWMRVFIGVLILDFAIYMQHVMFHAVPLFWRVHRMHHADLDFDVTTGVRFHPIEIILSMGIKIGIVASLGLPPLAVLIFEVLLNATSMFTHANLKLPLVVDRIIRWVIVTPDMHRVHHSIEREETDSNFGFNLSVWDRLFGTYRDQPKAGHDKMTIGITLFREPEYLRLPWLLAIPFLSKRIRKKD